MPSIWNNRKREQLELELIRLRDELRATHELFLEGTDTQEKRYVITKRISRCEEELSRLKKRKGWG